MMFYQVIQRVFVIAYPAYSMKQHSKTKSENPVVKTMIPFCFRVE